MKLSDFIEGLLLLAPYYDDPAYCIGAEHDQFFAYKTDRPLPEIKVDRLKALGWFQPDVSDDDDGNPGPYDPEEGWSCWT